MLRISDAFLWARLAQDHRHFGNAVMCSGDQA